MFWKEKCLHFDAGLSAGEVQLVPRFYDCVAGESLGMRLGIIACNLLETGLVSISCRRACKTRRRQ